MLKYVVISNWSNKDQAEHIAWSESDGIGVAQPTLALTTDKAILELDSSRFEAEGNLFENPDYQLFDNEGIKEEKDSLEWTDEPSEGGEIEI